MSFLINDCHVIIKPAHEVDQATKEMMFRRRKEVFVDELKWDLPFYDGSDQEKDQFDTDEAFYSLFYARGELIYSARFLPYKGSMIHRLWPEMVEHAEDGSWEISRFVNHGTSAAEYGRACVFLFVMSAYSVGKYPLFAIATPAVLALYRRVLKFKPDFQQKYKQYGGIYFVRWDAWSAEAFGVKSEYTWRMPGVFPFDPHDFTIPMNPRIVEMEYPSVFRPELLCGETTHLTSLSFNVIMEIEGDPFTFPNGY